MWADTPPGPSDPEPPFVRCPGCGGKGADRDEDGWHKCGDCNGDGKVLLDEHGEIIRPEYVPPPVHPLVQSCEDDSDDIPF